MSGDGHSHQESNSERDTDLSPRETLTCPHSPPYTGQEQGPKLDKLEGTEEEREEHQEEKAGSTGYNSSRGWDVPHTRVFRTGRKGWTTP